ncbi:MAG: hypothetical protein ACYDDS_20160 [Candidatus Sulfotelmatobacter sp.]|jgi:hypothetical protein
MLADSLLILLTLLAVVPAKPADVVPDFRDLTIRTQATMDSRHSQVMTWYFKGSRMRSEMQYPDAASSAAFTNIYQCDRAVRIFFNESSKTYDSVPADPTQMRGTARPTPEIRLSGGEVAVTTDSVDTGERRPAGSYQARHVKTTITVEPGPEAVSHKSTTEIAGWYLDLPGLYCQDTSAKNGWSMAWLGRLDRIVFKRLGAAARGFAIEETTRKSEDGKVFVQKIELLELSEKPLDESLFEIPAGYSLATAKAGP